jgi:murein hydrolase activator
MMLNFKKDTSSILLQLILFLAVCTFMPSSFLRAQTISDLQKRKDKTKQEIEYINRLLNETGESSKVTINKLSMINQQITLRNNLIFNYNSQLQLLQHSIDNNILAIEMMNGDIENLRAQYADMIKQAYRNKGNYSQLVFLLSSESFNQAYKRMLYLRQMARFRQNQTIQIEAIRSILKTKTIELSQREEQQQNVINQQLAESSKLNLEMQKQSDYHKKLQQKEKELKKNLVEQQKVEERLQREIERLIAEEAKKTKTTPITPEEKTLSNSFEKNKGKFPWPVEKGIITDKFGEHAHPVMKHIIIKNNGIDITTSPGITARSIFNGTISRVFAIPGGNKAVIVRHGEYITVYSNLNTVFVKQGDVVVTKQEIGSIYSDETEDNKTVLKFQIWKENLKLNPEEWISR